MPCFLKINEDQCIAILTQLNSPEFKNLKYKANDVDDQQQAQALLSLMKLDLASLELLETRWSVQNSELWGKMEKTESLVPVVFASTFLFVSMTLTIE